MIRYAPLLFLIGALAATPAFANDDSEIVVTAQKREERLKDVPASVAVLGLSDLAKQGIVRFTDYAARVPGLSLTSVRTGQAQITLRGITTGFAQSASATGYYIDEAPIGSVNAYSGGSATTPDLDPSDLTQIEILKGPQGTLYGANAVGGLLKFVTTPADFDAVGGRVSGGLTHVASGEAGFFGRGIINLPIVTDRVALRASGFYRRDPGYIDNVNARIGRADVNRAIVKGGRILLAAKISDDVRLDLSAMAQDTASRGLNTVDVDAVTLQPLFGDLAQNRQVAETGQVKFRLYNATLRASVGTVDLLSSTTYQHVTFRTVTDGSRSYGQALGGIGIRSTQITRSERWSQEVRASADGVAGGLFDLQGGFYWTHEQGSNRIPRFDPFSLATGAELPLANIITASILSRYGEYSLFANARLHLADSFDVLGGIRWSHDAQDYYQNYAGALVGGGPRINSGTEKGDIVTWMVSPRWRLSPQAMLYARAASGYRPGGPNAVVAGLPAPGTFAPDRLVQYEVGFKGSALGERLTIDAALFHTRWKDIQIQTSAGGFNFLVNGGTAKSQGAELTLGYRPLDGLTLAANLAYIDARLTSAAPAAGGLSGDRLPYVPKLSGSASAQYRAPVATDMEGVVGATVNFASSRVNNYSGAVAGATRFPKRLAGYATLDVRAGIEKEAWSLSLFAKNVTDKRFINVAITSGLAPSNTPGVAYNAAYNAPRTIGAEAAFSF